MRCDGNMLGAAGFITACPDIPSSPLLKMLHLSANATSMVLKRQISAGRHDWAISDCVGADRSVLRNEQLATVPIIK